MDLSGDTLSVRVDYNAGVHTKLFNNYIYCLRRVMVKNGMTEASNQVDAVAPPKREMEAIEVD